MVADYKKKNKNDISLTAGETVDVIERNDYGKYSISWRVCVCVCVCVCVRGWEGCSEGGGGSLVTLHSISSTSFSSFSLNPLLSTHAFSPITD